MMFHFGYRFSSDCFFCFAEIRAVFVLSKNMICGICYVSFEFFNSSSSIQIFLRVLYWSDKDGASWDTCKSNSGGSSKMVLTLVESVIVYQLFQVWSVTFTEVVSTFFFYYIKVITKLPNSEQSYKGKVQTHYYINRQNQSTTGKLWKPQWPWLGTGISKEMVGWIRF